MIVALATGSGRCGTQTFGAQMQRLPGVLGVHEGVPLYGKRGARNKNMMPHLVCGDPAAVDWNLRALKARREKFFSESLTAYAEGAHYFALNLPLAEEVLPEAKIIHLLRDPAEMVWSMILHASRGMTEFWIYKGGRHNRSLGKWSWWGDSFPLWPEATDKASGFALYWQHANEEIEKTSLPRLLVQTPELRSSETWKTMLDFLGIEGKVEQPSLAFNALPRKSPMPDWVRETVARICTWKPRT